MKLTTSLLIIAMAASASAQQKPADQPAPVKAGTVTLAPAKPAAAQPKTATAPAKNATAPAATKAPRAAAGESAGAAAPREPEARLRAEPALRTARIDAPVIPGQDCCPD